MKDTKNRRDKDDRRKRKEGSQTNRLQELKTKTPRKQKGHTQVKKTKREIQQRKDDEIRQK